MTQEFPPHPPTALFRPRAAASSRNPRQAMRHFRPIDLLQTSHTRCCLAIPTPFTRVSKSTFPDEALTQSRREPEILEARHA